MLCTCATGAARVSTVRDADVRPEGSEDSGRWFVISCPVQRTSCTHTAGLLCPDGYVVVNAVGYQVASSQAGLPEALDGELRVRCIPSFIRDGP